MITMKIKIKADTEEHLKMVIEDISHAIKMERKFSECWYIWPDTYFLIERIDIDDNIKT